MEFYKYVDGERHEMSLEEIEEIQRIAKENEEIRNREKLFNTRLERNSRLIDSDWVVIRAFESGTQVPQAWIDYRQALRDVPQQSGFPNDVTWPSKP